MLSNSKMTTKTCPPGKIVNPATNRCVKIDGKIGKAILAARAAQDAKSKSTSVKTSSKETKAKLLKELKDLCNNDTDPISMDNFEDLTVEQLENIIAIGDGTKKNCYLLENIYEVYKTAVQSRKPAKDPINPSHTLTNAEIETINKKMKAQNPKYEPPRYESPRPYPRGYELEIEPSPVYMNYFTVKVMLNNAIKFDLGLIPGWVESHHTGSVDYTTGVLLSNLRDLWDKRLFMNSVQSCCNVRLRRGYNYWQGSQWKNKFIALCEEVSNKLNA
jgi:hypothetical protein